LGLTSAKDRENFFERHVLDAVTLASILPIQLRESQATAIDVGTGNGVPGLVLALLFPHWQMTLLDSDTKKCGFLDAFCISSYIKNVSVHLGRAEEYARLPIRESFDLAVCRALGGISTSLELIAGFVKIGGIGIVSHGTSLKEKIKELTTVPAILGFEHEMHIYKVGDHTYTALQLTKTKETPIMYPRRVGRPAKAPL
jgi:16S rRNA (guanine527-N7)-methyltransferase